ncbi:branched-chain amino acid ABC transporter permease [Paroceanicella profunda]|uniref:Branched-chain amino acid ABC transporter permease n=1 Tax=Paroceanicella profunda TaxID=2579971 RepID=A0A5B8FWV5_9RHOB|nr:branched-chain amino acid ABC transporter permease [Paroceanicella profunda]QDL90533.1 branched-chain amino acid ABC transporter permease [Paroceanicella profunda]
MDLFLQYLANGIVIGSAYVLVAIGLTLIFGILGVVNFAHGEFYMLGAYAGVLTVTLLGLPLIAALVVVIAFSAVLGVFAEAILHRALRERDMTSSIIASFGLAVALQNAALLTIGPRPMLLQTDLSMLAVEFGPVYLPLPRALIPVAMVVMVGLLFAVLRYTWTGRSLRAMAQHRTVARLCGVRVERVAMVTFMVGAGLAGVSGFLMSSVLMVTPVIGNMIVLKAFTVVILGGMGDIMGAAVAGLLLGVVETMTSAYLTNGLRDIIGFVIVIAVLLFRPQGLFGKSVERS